MKIILVGYPGSQFIVPASKYLTDKYLPDFDIEYINWEGDKKQWSKFLVHYLGSVEDEFVIFALDDYLLNSPIDMDGFNKAMDYLNDKNVMCVKLCPNTQGEHEEYPVTTQYTIWRKDFLMWLMTETTDPWDFETRGSQIFKATGKKSILSPCLSYPTHSCLSTRWDGIRFDGVTEEDKEYIIKNLL